MPSPCGSGTAIVIPAALRKKAPFPGGGRLPLSGASAAKKTPPAALERSGERAADGIAFCLFAGVQSPKEGHDLRSGAVLIRAEQIAADAVGDAVVRGPLDRFRIVRVVGHIPESGAAGSGTLDCPGKEGDGLGSRAGRIGREFPIAGAGGNAVFHRPCHRLGIVAVRRNIGKAALRRRLGRARRTPQEGDDLGPAAGLLRPEQVVADPAGDAVFRRPFDRFIIISVDGHIVKGADLDLFGKDGLDLHLARRHGKGILSIALVGERKRAAVLIGDGKVLQLEAVVRLDRDGHGSLNIIKRDPFQLCRIRGFGFLTVDAIAKKTKVSLKNPLRYAGAINFALEEARNFGHLFLLRDALIERCHILLNDGLDAEVVTTVEIADALQSEHQAGTIYIEHERVYLAFERVCEVQAAKRLVSLLLSDPVPQIRNLNQEIQQTEAKIGLTLAPSQRAAVKLCLENRCTIMTGGPGVGKTATLRAILDIYHRLYPKHELLLAAPTGKASRRMTEQTGLPAFTLHSAMGIASEEDLEETCPDFLSADFIPVDRNDEEGE